VILREILHAHFPVLNADSTVRDAVDKMDIYQFPALVVVNDDHQPIAVVTEGDICRSAVQKDGVLGLAKQPAIEHASKSPKTADVNVEISDALHLMLSSGITILPITDEGRLAGVVLRVDLMQAMMMDAAEKS
jgi:predicted transcriptional regulator